MRIVFREYRFEPIESEYYRKRRSTVPTRHRRQEYEYEEYGYDYYAQYDPAVLECLSNEIEKERG